MRIGIDISQIIYGTGVSVYTKKLIDNLLRIDNENQYILFGGSFRRKNELLGFTSSLKGNVSSTIYPLPPTLMDLMWNRLRFPNIEVLTGKIDVLHASDWTQPPTEANSVTTVHDLFALKYPKSVPKKIFYSQKARMNKVLEYSDHIIVPSISTKGDVVALGFSEDRVTVIHEAPGEEFSRATKDEIERIRRKYNIKQKYLLAVGVGERKNTARIITAYEKARSEGLKLVIVGQKWLEMSHKRGIKFLGHVPDGDLPALYSGAEALVYASLYEGFGLPILEAMSCECPVVTSDTSSMPEVAGDAAVLVDPYDVNSISDGIEVALSKPKTLIRAGKKRIKEFSWEQAAKETLEVYNSLDK